MIEFDTETTSLQWYAGEVFLAQFHDDTGATRVIPNDGDANALLIQDWLRQSDGYRAWNSKFDLHFLREAGYNLPPEDQWHDGQLLAHVVDERISTALAARGERIVGDHIREPEKAIKDALNRIRAERRKASKETGERFVDPNYSDVPPDIMEPYAAGDVEVQRQVCQRYERAVEANPELRDVYELERRTLRALYHMERRGLPMDRSALVALERHSLDKTEPLYDRCVELAGIKTFNPGSPKQVGEALDRRGADLTFTTKTSQGWIKTDEENLLAVDDDLAGAILQLRAEEKLYRYVRPLLHGGEASRGLGAPFLTEDDRVHPSFNQVGARTGRMSCSAPNIQQWHRDDLRLRYAVKAPPGYKLVACDLDAIEMRLFAAFCGEGLLLQSIIGGEDIHELTARAVGLTGYKRATGTESARQQGKRFNYAVVYGAGVRAIRKWLHVPQDKARQMLRQYHSTYPEVSALQDRIEYTLEERGYVKTPWGRRHRVERDARQESYKFVNYLVQGTAADLFKDSISQMHEAGIPLVGAFHDEALALVPEKDAREVGHTMQECLTAHPAITEKVPILAEPEIVTRWSEAKDPAFKPDYLG